MNWSNCYQRCVKKRCKSSKEKCKEISEICDKGEVVLLLGSGVTSCLVGTWTELLNELAMMRCADESMRGSYSYNKEDYDGLKRLLTNNRFIPSDIDVLEQGEYLRYDPKDPWAGQHQRSKKYDNWREFYFATQVDAAISRLIDKNLRNGDGQDLRELEKDFVLWYKNETDADFLNIPRRMASNNSVYNKGYTEESTFKKTLEGHTEDELFDAINLKFGKGIRFDKLKKAVSASNKRLTAKILGVDESVIEDAIKEKDLKMVLIKTAVALYRRPDYSTLSATLKLCFKKKIKKIINYNFDTVFEELLSNETIAKLYGCKAINVEIVSYYLKKPILMGEEKTTDKLISEHVHGVLTKRHPVTPLIFSEYSYLDFQQDFLNWSQLRISETLDQASVLCIGFSGVDSNFRYMIRQHMKQMDSPLFGENSTENSDKITNNRKIYLVRACSPDVARFSRLIKENAGVATPLDKRSRSLLKNIEICLKSYFDMAENYYIRSFGIEILWGEDFGGLADIIESISKKKRKSVKGT